jgi:hypothetical protein
MTYRDYEDETEVNWSEISNQLHLSDARKYKYYFVQDI